MQARHLACSAQAAPYPLEALPRCHLSRMQEAETPEPDSEPGRMATSGSFPAQAMLVLEPARL
ncbi:hypothetical protein AA3990_0192 [Gluconobacter roseus NBRC 3990]|nr:hypothetical protein AA3990_0192 [Gluconobacter roseus NBRC 3990]